MIRRILFCEMSDQIYRWFMEMFVDSCDWVMVPNVYTMSQHADGGSSNKALFLRIVLCEELGNHPNGDWTKIWDGLWR